MRKAFTMVELVFVIVVIGILAAIAVPKFAVTRDDAMIAKARATVGALRSAIATERQKRILKGDFSDITDDEAEALLEYGLDSHWSGLTYTGPDGNTCTFSVQNNKLVKGDCGVSGLNDL
jgi:general secretion pathway protein G